MFADIELLPALLGDAYGHNEIPLPDEPGWARVGAVEVDGFGRLHRV